MIKRGLTMKNKILQDWFIIGLGAVVLILLIINNYFAG